MPGRVVVGGSRTGEDELAPLYDACSWIPYRRSGQEINDLSIAMTIGDSYEVAETDQPAAIVSTAETLGLPTVSVAERFQELAALMPDALAATVRSLPMDWQNLPIVSAYLTEQKQRAEHCRRIAVRAVDLARSIFGR